MEEISRSACGVEISASRWKWATGHSNGALSAAPDDVVLHLELLAALRARHAEGPDGDRLRGQPGLKGSIDEGPNHSNFLAESSVKILSNY